MKMAILADADQSVRPVLSAGEPSWQAEIRLAVRGAGELCRRLGLPSEMAVGTGAGVGELPVFVPPSFLARIRPGDPKDPLLRQVLPMVEENDVVPGFTSDPVGDGDAKLASGVLQKYLGRALLIATGSCAVHCRYCFRRHFPYEEAPHSSPAWDAALALVAEDPTITEVILSGGDPLMLVDARLAVLVEKIEAIEQVTRLRIHTRLPIMVPLRVTHELLAMLESNRLSKVMVVHANHAQELAEDVAAALGDLRHVGVTLLNQAVLLRGVNDSVEAQQALSERLIELGVVPYYLHQLDRVAGAAHFEVPIHEGQKIIEELRKRLPGYMVPRYVQEVAGEASKTILF
jgi:L-lysine 2,3-aminomutase